MATSEEDRSTPSKKSADATGNVGDGEPPTEKHSPPWQPETDSKNRPKPVVQKGAEATGDVERRLPPRQPGNPKGKDHRKPVAKKSAKATSDVGYSKPPESTRFLPRQSGNPAGRPLGAKNKVHAFGVEQLKETAMAELYRDIKTSQDGLEVTMPAATLILRKMVQKGVEGDLRAAQMLMTMGQNAEAEKKADQLELMQTVHDYKKAWKKEFARCKENGLPMPEPYPHPDHIIIDFHTGEVKINGPCSAEEKAHCDEFLKRKEANDKEISELEADLRGKLKPGYRKFLEECLADAKWVRGMIEKILPDWALTELQKPPGKE